LYCLDGNYIQAVARVCRTINRLSLQLTTVLERMIDNEGKHTGVERAAIWLQEKCGACPVRNEELQGLQGEIMQNHIHPGSLWNPQQFSLHGLTYK
jgi:hypothetical protein